MIFSSCLGECTLGQLSPGAEDAEIVVIAADPFSGSLGTASPGTFGLGRVPVVSAPTTGEFECNGSTAMEFEGETSPIFAPPQTIFSGVLGVATLGEFELGEAFAIKYFKSEGYTNVVFVAVSPEFKVYGETTVLFTAPVPEGAVYFDGTTTVVFTGKSTGNFQVDGSTIVQFQPTISGAFYCNGDTDVTFFAEAGQGMGCVSGDGVIPAVPGETSNYVF